MIPGPGIMTAAHLRLLQQFKLETKKTKINNQVQSMRGIKIIITVTHIIDRELQCRGHNHTPS